MFKLCGHGLPEKSIDESFVGQVNSRNLLDVPRFKVFFQGLPVSAESDVSPDVSKHTKFPTRLRCFWYFVYNLLTKTAYFKTSQRIAK